MEYLIKKLTNKYICLYNLFVVRGVWNKVLLTKRGVVEKRLRTTVLKQHFQTKQANLKENKWSGKNFQRNCYRVYWSFDVIISMLRFRTEKFSISGSCTKSFQRPVLNITFAIIHYAKDLLHEQQLAWFTAKTTHSQYMQKKLKWSDDNICLVSLRLCWKQLKIFELVCNMQGCNANKKSCGNAPKQQPFWNSFELF